MSKGEFVERLKEGKQFEEYVQQKLWQQHGIWIGLYDTAKEQWQKGESVLGYEVKLDNRCHETGNFYIQTEQRRDTYYSNWRKCGVLSEDNMKYYCIGNYKEVYVFERWVLQTVYNDLVKNKKDAWEGWGAKWQQGYTSRGFTVSMQALQPFWQYKLVGEKAC